MWRSAEESRFADETVNNDADMLFCPVDKISAVLRRKKSPAMFYLHLSLFFCRETPVKQENQAHMATSALQYGKKQTNSHMQNSKKSKRKLKVSE